MDSSYPRPISNWEGIPNNLDAATTYTNGKTYFFKGDKYYKFDDDKLEVARSAEYPYPSRKRTNPLFYRFVRIRI